MKIWKQSGFFIVVSLSCITIAQGQAGGSGSSGLKSGRSAPANSDSGANASANSNPAAPADGPFSGWSAYGTSAYRGGERFQFTGAYFTPYNRPLVFNPLTNFVWAVRNKPPSLGDNWFVGRVNNLNVDYWRGTAGYFYPWLNGGGTVTFYQGGVPVTIPAPIIFWGGAGGSEPISQLPPPAIQLADTMKFLDDSFKDKKVLEARYKHLKLRASDLQKKERSMRIAAGGELDKETEAEIRRDLESLTREMTAAVKTSV